MRKVIVLVKDMNLPQDKLAGKQLLDYLSRLVEVAKMIDHEDFEGYMDMEKFNILASAFKPSDPDYRNIMALRNHFSEWYDYSELDDSFPVVRVGQCDFASHIYGACAAYADELVVNHGAYAADVIKINIMDGPRLSASKTIRMLPCDDVEVYKWFTDHRDPKRKFDSNYLKHSRFGPRKVDNKKVSPLTIPEAQLMDCLKKSVGGKGERRIYFYDPEAKMLLVFYNQNDNNSFHGHEILPADKKKEEQKIDNAILNKMKKLFKYRRG